MPQLYPCRRCVAAAAVEALEGRRLLAAFTVTSTADTGPGSLREALALSNASPGLDTIQFEIPGSGVHTIQPASAMPVINDALVIDGYSQPGSSPNTNPPGTTPNAVQTIQLDGSLLVAYGRLGLRFTAGNSTVRGLSIFGVDTAVRMAGDNNVVEGNKVVGNVQFDNGAHHRAGGLTPAAVNVITSLGVLASDSVIQGNIVATIGISGGGNLIGGRTAAARNVVGPAFHGGVTLNGSNNRVEGNFIGTDVTGTQRNHNRRAGVFVTGDGNTIGGTAPGAGNVISGNERGVYLYEGSGNVIQGNIMGLDVTGTQPLGNTAEAVLMTAGASGNLIGGTAPGAGNIMSASGTGVSIFLGSENNIVQGNKIGTLADGTTAAGNIVCGVFIASNASNNLVGGSEAGAGNVIAFSKGYPSMPNSGAGVLVAANSVLPLRNAIRHNSIFGNAGLGIDLSADQNLNGDGTTPNDALDADSGANGLQNFPVVTSASSSASGTRVTGTMSSSAGATFRLEFFASPTADPSGAGEGQQFLGETTVTTDANGNASFDATLPTSATVGHVVAATATDAANDTSEFSRAVAVTAKPNLAPRSDRPILPGFATDSVGPQREPGHGLWRELIDDAEQTV